MKMKFLFIALFILISLSGFTQNKKKRASDQSLPQQQGSNSLHPNYYQQNSATSKSSKKTNLNSPTYKAEQRYYERVEEVAKMRKTNARLAKKPQYSDPMYFGHKRPPKKNPPHKMKFCKECGIRH